MNTQALVQPPAPPAEQYAALVASGHIQDDPAQYEALAALQRRYEELTLPSGLISRWFNKKQHAQSIYIWGSVGRGKSMLMDLFFDALPMKEKRRVHFHRFMQDVHARLHELRKAGDVDPMERYTKELCAKQRVLCFDELQATDVTDASIITRIFEGLAEENITVIATSNRPPKDLYQGQVQKERFDKLTALLNSYFEVIHLQSEHDHRREQVQALRTTYFAQLGAPAQQFIEETMHHLSPSHHMEIKQVEVQGRTLPIKSYGEHIALVTFDELCAQALGPADYLQLADIYEVVVMQDIPLLTPENRNEAKRFVTLIDALYEHDVLFICTAAAEPDKLYESGHGSFEFERTASRLVEMQSESYLQHASQHEPSS